MKAYKCDMCGKIILKRNISYSLVVWKKGNQPDKIIIDIDLCPACMCRVNEVLDQTNIKIEFMDEN